MEELKVILTAGDERYCVCIGSVEVLDKEYSVTPLFCDLIIGNRCTNSNPLTAFECEATSTYQSFVARDPDVDLAFPTKSLFEAPVTTNVIDMLFAEAGCPLSVVTDSPHFPFPAYVAVLDERIVWRDLLKGD